MPRDLDLELFLLDSCDFADLLLVFDFLLPFAATSVALLLLFLDLEALLDLAESSLLALLLVCLLLLVESDFLCLLEALDSTFLLLPLVSVVLAPEVLLPELWPLFLWLRLPDAAASLVWVFPFEALLLCFTAFFGAVAALR